MLTYYQEKRHRLLALRGVAATWLCLLLLLTRCQPYLEEAPEPVTTTNTTLTKQIITAMDGTIAHAETTLGTLQNGELIFISVPENWNGELILYAPGYTPAFADLHIAPEASTYGPLFNLFGYAFATTSYSENGLAIQSGIQDMINLRNLFIEEYGEPTEIYLTGASEGGLVTTLAVERYPELWSGGISLCGPCGDFQQQLNYYGHFRVLFDYLFPGVLPGTVVDVPQAMIDNWQTVYIPAILFAISQDPAKTLLLLNVAGAPYDPANPLTTIPQTVVQVLTYNLFIHDAVEKLGGQPFDNKDYVYSGTGSPATDLLLNEGVQRYSADKEAAKTIKKFYETSGNFKIPLVKSHTTLDHIQLFRNLLQYEAKVPTGKTSLFAAIPVEGYGHCTFTNVQVIDIFTTFIEKIGASKQHPLAKVKDVNGQIISSVREEKVLVTVK